MKANWNETDGLKAQASSQLQANKHNKTKRNCQSCIRLVAMPCLILQYKPYIVELPPKKEAYNEKYVAIVSTSTLYMHSLNQQFNS